MQISEIDIDINAIVKETLENVNAKQRFIESYNETFYLTELTYKIRLSRWLRFFNERYLKNPVLIKNTYFALLDYCRSNELFRTQTQNEFETSLLFYDKIIDHSSLAINDDEVIGKKILTISLIYGKYPGMQTKSINEALKTLPVNFQRDDITCFIAKLMVKFQIPNFILNHIELLDLKEVDILMFYLRGNNLNKYPELDFKISNKEQEIMLFQIPENITIQDNIIKKTVAIAKIIRATDNPFYIAQFFNRCKIFNYRIDDFLIEINFWIKAYNLIAESINPYTNNDIIEYLDYIEHKKRELGSTYNLKGVTPESLENSVNEWHNNTNNSIDNDLLNSKWEGAQKENTILEIDGDTYEFSEITDGKTLFKESNMMKHCVFSYVNNCLEGKCSIWSLKKKQDSVFKNLLTIEIQGNEIVQVRGKHNRSAIHNELNVIENWASVNNYIFINQ